MPMVEPSHKTTPWTVALVEALENRAGSCRWRSEYDEATFGVRETLVLKVRWGRRPAAIDRPYR